MDADQAHELMQNAINGQRQAAAEEQPPEVTALAGEHVRTYALASIALELREIRRQTQQPGPLTKLFAGPQRPSASPERPARGEQHEP
jgi:hypothetical protein